MLKWLPSILTVLGALLTALTPQLSHVISAHPTLFTVIGSILGVVLHTLPSPVQSK